MSSACCGWDTFGAAADAADDLLASAYHVNVTKALNPLDAKDFNTLLLRIARDLKGIALPVEATVVRGVLERLDVDWLHMKPEARWAVVGEAKKYLAGAPEQILPKIDQKLSFYAKDIVAKTKSKAILTYDLGISANMNATDDRVMRYTRESQGHFIRDQFGKRADGFATKARDIVANGLESGLGSKDIAEKLSGELGSLGRNDNYWNIIAMVFANRARTMTQLASFSEAGITEYEWESVMDEATSVQCRFLHKKRFPVATAMKQFQSVEDSSDPEEIKALQPFINVGSIDGKPSLYYGRGDNKTLVANITDNAVGHADKIGGFSNELDAAALAKAGIVAPPIHGFCRSTIVPHFGATGTGAVPSAPPEPVAQPKAPPKPKEPKAPPLPAEFGDPDATLEFGKEPLYEGLPLNGVPLAPAPALEWTQIPDAIEEPPLPQHTKVSSGVIIVEPDGRIWIVEPKDHFGGYEHTYPKGKIDPGLTAQQNALKELHEEAGLHGKIVGVVGDFAGQTGTTRYYVAHRTGGAPWQAHWESEKVKLVSMSTAQTLLNTERDKKVLAELKKKLSEEPALFPKMPDGVAAPKAPKKPKAPKAPKPVDPEIASSANIMHEFVGAPQGSNRQDGAGFYVGKDGVKRYVKFYDDASQAHGEHLANAIYNDLGLGAPKSEIFEHNGRVGYASQIIEGQTLSKAGITKENARAFMKGFTGDILTANWDAAGLSLDNAFIGPKGKIFRIDNGGSFLMRAQGDRKQGYLLNAITEWEYFFSGNNDGYAQVLRAAGYTKPEDFRADLVKQLRAVAELQKSSGGWDAYVTKISPGLSGTDRTKVVAMLDERSRLLGEKLAGLEGTKAKKPTGEWGARSPSLGGIAPRAGLRISDLPELPPPPHDPNGSRTNLPKNLPSGESHAEYRAKVAKQIAPITGAQRSAIYEFTGSGYTEIRGYEEGHNSYGKQLSDDCTAAFKKAKPEARTVYRGIQSLPADVAEKMIQHEGVFKLGRGNVGATSSATWSPEVAVANFMGGSDDEYGPTVKILFQIHQKNGIPIETISAYGKDPVSWSGNEAEILLSREQSFKVLKVSRWKGKQRIVMIELEEVDG